MEGRNISPQVSDSTLVKEALINESALERLGFRNAGRAIGETVDGRYRIVGVVEDFHLRSLKEKIDPVLLSPVSKRASVLNIRVNPQQMLSRSIEDLRRAWVRTGRASGNFNFSILEDRVKQQYEEEERAAGVIGIFAFISVIIACLGLYGLAAFIAHQRMQEIGIRKVLGASTGSIILLLYKDFGKIIGVSAITAIPLIYYAANEWLQNFAYRMNPGPELIVIPLVIVTLISIISTGTNSLRAALMNPVDSIRNE